MIEKHALPHQQEWIAVTAPTPSDYQKLHTDCGLPKKFIPYLEDVRERARLEYDAGNKYWLLVFRFANKQAAVDGGFITLPITFVFNDERLISFIQNPAGNQVTDELKDVIQNAAQLDRSIFLVLFDLLFSLATDYFDVIDAINDHRDKLETWHRRPSNDQVEALTQLSQQTVYLTTAENNNLIAVERFRLATNSPTDPLDLDATETDRLNDVLVEIQQGREMAQIAADIIDRVTSGFSNVLNNNLNDTMRFLTVWSIVLMIPPVITGFYGMNVALPYADRHDAWFWTIIWSLLGIIVLGIWYILYDKRKR
ncbi:magnesium transporter CorA family protein [Schleiferilactobacillus perolens]|jgi:magnesium transporter|uniref:magnesium transporter CorA family protein n=1 Tax=Schleiferilactobacillus perolens TaxID=100468 RepID=UPI0023571766|nr:magnesium transporter CorA family protein [Schleiferilactobacillus perolens]MCI1892762.1 magnesium transporter CorA family protein [Schleiferilactobacillus harbinensis]MCI1913895.1 magnesium transporter CorA family protein [Schleiferilactobacillus harbinensis]MCI2170763.1 magnesium transporter CorA family protein [Schleiferilactobacillus perolens]